MFYLFVTLVSVIGWLDLKLFNFDEETIIVCTAEIMFDSLHAKLIAIG